MQPLVRRASILILMFIVSTSSFAQDDATCDAIQQTALEQLTSLCGDLNPNEACLGYGQATLDDTEMTPGEIVSLDGIDTLQLSALNPDDATLGMVLIKPDLGVGASGTMLLYGDVQIENTSPYAAGVWVSQNLNLRDGPTSGNYIIGALKPDQLSTAFARNATGDWLRVKLPDGTVGWTYAPYVLSNDDLMLLDVVAPDDDTPYVGPMQSFHLNTGENTQTCANESGILIQIDQEDTRIPFEISGALVELQGTNHIGHSPDGELLIQAIDGRANTSINEEIAYAMSGTQLRIAVDDERVASATPIGPEPYGEVADLPVGGLPVEVTIAPPLSVEEIAGQIAQAAVIPGTWVKNFYLVTTTCDYKPYQDSSGLRQTITLLEDGNAIQIVSHYPTQPATTDVFYRADINTFIYYNPVQNRLMNEYSITVVSPDYIEYNPITSGGHFDETGTVEICRAWFRDFTRLSTPSN